MIEIDVRVDDGVPLQRSKRRRRVNQPVSRDPAILRVVESFQAMKPGQSFFVPGAVVDDLNFLRRPFKQAGLAYTMRHVERDEIYQTSGVRVWRQHGEYDEL